MKERKSLPPCALDAFDVILKNVMEMVSSFYNKECEYPQARFPVAYYARSISSSIF